MYAFAEHAQAIAHDAFRALVNLSDTSLLVPHLSDTPFLSFLVSYICTPAATLADLAAMLLANLSAASSVAAALMALTIPVVALPGGALFLPAATCATAPPPGAPPDDQPRAIPVLPLLLDAFVQAAAPAVEGKPKREGSLHFLASVFANLSSVRFSLVHPIWLV